MFSIKTISRHIHAPAKPGDVGYNLLAVEDVWIRKGEVSIIHTGVKVKLPDGFWAIITARSSAVFKHKLLVFSGIIDNGYTGELMVTATAIEHQVQIKCGESIGQLILFPIVTPQLELVQELPQTERGENGFGSTGLAPCDTPSGPGNIGE